MRAGKRGEAAGEPAATCRRHGRGREPGGLGTDWSEEKNGRRGGCAAWLRAAVRAGRRNSDRADVGEIVGTNAEPENCADGSSRRATTDGSSIQLEKTSWRPRFLKLEPARCAQMSQVGVLATVLCYFC